MGIDKNVPQLRGFIRWGNVRGRRHWGKHGPVAGFFLQASLNSPRKPVYPESQSIGNRVHLFELNTIIFQDRIHAFKETLRIGVLSKSPA
jgi:hypothetical protein